jgi:YegS/Rv2252/BmrU family lipid kinase
MAQKPRRASTVFVVLNPVAGTSNRDEVVAALEQRFAANGQQYEIYETTGDAGEDIPALVRAAVGRGADLVVAAGGDGTVSLVAGALAGGDVPLGVLPIGTANVFAQVLGLPLDLAGAADLATGEFVARPIDGMRVGDKLGVLHISVGITSLMQRDTSRELKRRYGRFAYMYVAARWLFGFQPQRFNVVIDGKRRRFNASQVLIANGGEMGQAPFTWGPDIAPDDGVIDICVINASTFQDYLMVGWSTLTGRHHRNHRLRYYKARSSVSVNTRKALPVQLDGELAGSTPLQVQVVPGAFLCAVAPVTAQSTAGVDLGAGEAPSMDRAVGEPVSATAAAEAAPVAATLRNKLAQIEAPEEARLVVDELIRGAGDAKVPERAPSEAPANPAQAVVNEARKPGPAGVAGAILETAAQVSVTEGETQEAIAQAAQKATNPEVIGVDDPALRRPLELLRVEILRRMAPYQAVDARLFLAVNGLPHPPEVNRAMYAFTNLMNIGFGWVIALLVATALDRRRGSRALRQVLPPLWIATTIVEYPIKHYFRRKRPFIDLVQAISVGKKPGTYSFPSGHSAAAFAGAWLLTRHYPRLAPLWYTVAALTGFSRVYLGAHYPGDVLSGAVAGTTLAEAARRAIDALDE